MQDIIKLTNKALSFALELAMLAGFCYWGFFVGRMMWLKLALGIGIPALIIVIWGLFLAPTAKRRLKIVQGSIVSAALFIASAAALSGSGHSLAAYFLAFAAVINLVLKLTWRQW